MFSSDTPILQFRGPFGIPVEIGASILFLAFIFLFPFTTGADLIDNLIFFALILLAIFLHEMGHAWGTIIQGHAVKRVVIYGGGGFCEGTKVLSRNEEEFVVIMGPLVNLGLWALSSLAVPYADNLGWITVGDYFYWFADINFFLFCLNMIPVQPLDGGKLLYLTLRRWYDRGLCIRIAGGIGLLFAVLWIPAMIYAYLTLGYLLLFMPSIPLHLRMFQGKAA